VSLGDQKNNLDIFLNQNLTAFSEDESIKQLDIKQPGSPQSYQNELDMQFDISNTAKKDIGIYDEILGSLAEVARDSVDPLKDKSQPDLFKKPSEADFEKTESPNPE